MDRTVEAKMWRRGFAAGFLALALSAAGQAATGVEAADVPACPIRLQFGVAERLVQKWKPAARSHGGVAQRVALAVLGAVLHSGCS